MKAGREYELLIANLYRSLEPNAEVKHDDHIYDSTAKITRQIDVSIKSKLAGVDILIIIQVKDYSKNKADVAVVDQFKTIIDDTKASKGILICSKGFTKAALIKAEFHKIECLTVHSALNKNWGNELKFPVKKIVHNFDLELSFILDVRDNKDKEVKLLLDSFSFDGFKIISIADVIQELIIKKKGWDFIKNNKNIRIDLSRLTLFHSYGNEMLRIIKGFIQINYVKSTVKNFYIDPVNYTYSEDLIKKSGTLHDLTISEETIYKIFVHEHENDKDIKDSPAIIGTTYSYNNMQYSYNEITFNVKGVIEGKFLTDGSRVLIDNERGQEIVKLERILKGDI